MKKTHCLLILFITLIFNPILEAKTDVNPDFYIQEYGAIDVRILNFNEIYKLTQSWGAENFVENSSLWAILTGKHRVFGMFNGLTEKPNHGPKVLRSIMYETLPLILGQAYLPESSISTIAFEKKCHDRVANGIKNFGFLSADLVDTNFFRLEIIDSAGLGILSKSKEFQYNFKSVAYQWIIFDSISKCNTAIEKLKQKYTQPSYQYFVDDVVIKSNYYRRYRNMLTYSGLGLKTDNFYLVKSNVHNDGKLVYHLDFFKQAKIITARDPGL